MNNILFVTFFESYINHLNAKTKKIPSS